MTEPSQYFKGRTVQEQMDEVISYVDKRAEEVAAAKADAVLQPAEDAKTAAQAAAQQAEAAKDTTLAALPEIRQDISGLKAEDTALDGRLDTVELKVQTAEGNIVTIQGRITAIENKNTQQDSAIAALQTADGQNVKINNVNQYAVGLTGNQVVAGRKDMLTPINGGYMLFNSQLNVFAEGEFVRVFRGASFGQTHLMIYGTQANNGLGLIDILAGGSNNYDRSVMIGSFGYISESKIVVVQVSDHTEVWLKRTNRVGFISVIVTHALTSFETEGIVQGTGLTSPPVIGGTDPITNETITGIKELN